MNELKNKIDLIVNKLSRKIGESVRVAPSMNVGTIVDKLECDDGCCVNYLVQIKHYKALWLSSHLCADVDTNSGTSTT